MDDEQQRGGSVTALVGLSGSGKSTLLHLVGGVDRGEAGNWGVLTVELMNRPPARPGDQQRPRSGEIWVLLGERPRCAPLPCRR